MKKKTKSYAKKRFFKTKGWKWIIMRMKANHRHRLNPKTRLSKSTYWTLSIAKAEFKRINAVL
jgi:ribosomal protein L35